MRNKNNLKVIIAGDRNFVDYEFLKEKCDYHLQGFLEEGVHIEIVSGKARGADSLGEEYAKEMGFPVKEFPADWDKYKKGAGPIRNGQMADYADMLIAFLAPNSKGTANMISQAQERELIVRVEHINESQLRF